jgi:hypothetical protein
MQGGALMVPPGLVLLLVDLRHHCSVVCVAAGLVSNITSQQSALARCVGQWCSSVTHQQPTKAVDSIYRSSQGCTRLQYTVQYTL